MSPRPSALALLGVCMVGCATVVTMASLTRVEQDRIQARSFDAPDSLLYSAVLASYADVGYTFSVHDQSAGLIQTEPLMYASNDDRDVWTTALVGAKFRYRRRVSARIRNGVVKLNYTFEFERKGQYYGESGWEPWYPDTGFSNSAYRAAFKGIKQQLRER